MSPSALANRYPLAAQAGPSVNPDTSHFPAVRVRLTLLMAGANGFVVTEGENFLLTA
jgi:hypothetical protein